MSLFTDQEREYLNNSGFLEYSFTDQKTFLKLKKYLHKILRRKPEEFEETKIFYDPNIISIKNKFYQVYDILVHYNPSYNFFIKRESYAKYLNLRLSTKPKKFQVITGSRISLKEFDLLIDLYYIKQKTTSWKYFYTLKISGRPSSVESFTVDVFHLLFGKRIASIQERKDAIIFITDLTNNFNIPRVFTTDSGKVFVYNKISGLKASNAVYLPNSIIQ